jgi:hypothetical protein
MKGNPSQSELIYVNDLVDLLCECRTHPRRDLIGALQIPTLPILSAGGSDEESIKAHNGKDRASLHSDYEHPCRFGSDWSIWRFSPRTPDAQPK